MPTVGDLEHYCIKNKIKFTPTYHNSTEHLSKITITKTRAVKVVLKWGRVNWYFWDARRKCYSGTDCKSWSCYTLKPDKEITQEWYDSIVELLQTEQNNEKTKFEVIGQEFDKDLFSRYTNGLVKLHSAISQAFVSGVVKVTDRGIVKEMQTNDECACWFLIEGRSKCVSSCDGKPMRIIYDGEKCYSCIEKTDKSYRISQDQLKLSAMDKTVIDCALELFLTLKEKDG